MKSTKFHLTRDQFADQERLVLEQGDLRASTFRYPTGVEAVRLTNEWGELVLLPYQGQQIWSATFGGPDYPRRDLTMHSMFNMPRPTRDFLATFGAFLVHCGITGAGAPGPDDPHELHGELPNASFDSAYLLVGENERGAFVGLGGVYEYIVAFSHHYEVEPLVKLYADESMANVSLQVTNLKNTPMEMMYGAHINFRPVDHGRIVYSATRTPEHVRLRAGIPSHITPTPAFAALMEKLEQDLTLHEILDPAIAFDPEVVFFIDYNADEQGYAHSLQIHPDGSADYVRHRPAELPCVTRWISRQPPDQDAIAMAEVGTCEMEGYHAEKAKGNILTLAPGASFVCEYDTGLLVPGLAAGVAAHVEKLDLV